jgi:hypothetical protein
MTLLWPISIYILRLRHSHPQYQIARTQSTASLVTRTIIYLDRFLDIGAESLHWYAEFRMTELETLPDL